MNLWVVGKVSQKNPSEWEFQGVFDSEEKAIAACVEQNFGYGPAILNESLPSESEDWCGWTYPGESSK